MTTTTPWTKEEFAERAERALGGYGWISAMARISGKNIATVRRWIDGVSAVPGYAAAIVELLEVIPTHLRPRRFFARPLLGRHSEAQPPAGPPA